MSRDLLALLADRYTFDGSPSFADLGAYHVPFDDLVGGSRVEASIAAGATRGERIVILAESGSGKSSVISHVLGPSVEGIAPIVVPVRPLEGGATNPARVAYAEGASIRRVLQLSHIALSEAIDSEAEGITADHVVAALRSG